MLESLRSIFSKSTNRITVNGRTFTGDNVTVRNNRVYVDGKEVLEPSSEVIITVEGDVATVSLDTGVINITGNAGDIRVDCGSVDVNLDVKGAVNVNQGNVECNDIYADVAVNMGQVSAGTIHGSSK